MTEETKNYMAIFLNKVKPKDGNETQPIPINNENKKEDETKLKDYLETDVQTLLGIFDHYSKNKKRNRVHYSDISDSNSTSSDSSYSYSSDSSNSSYDSIELTTSSDSSSSEESDIEKRKKIIKKIPKKIKKIKNLKRN